MGDLLLGEAKGFAYVLFSLSLLHSGNATGYQHLLSFTGALRRTFRSIEEAWVFVKACLPPERLLYAPATI